MASLNEDVKSWWNANPFTYGLSDAGNGYKDVGDIPDERLDLGYFDEYMRKVRKHFDDAQEPGQPIAGRFVDYPSLKGLKALDISCGSGWSTVELARAGADVTAIDIAPRAVAVCRRHLEVRGLEADVRVMDAQRLDFPDAAFDYVLAWGCLMHMPDTPGAVSEARRVLKPGGRSAGYMYNKSSLTYWWNFWLLRGVLMGQLLRHRGDMQAIVNRNTDGSSLGGNRLTKVYTPREAEEMFRRSGFSKAEFSSWGPPETMVHFPSRVLPLGGLAPLSWRQAAADRWGWGMVYTARR